MMKSNEVLILLDADVIIHLFKADKLTLLNELYNKRLRVLDIVLEELNSNKTINKNLTSIISFLQLKKITFPLSLLTEYISLKKIINGNGESACLTYCKNYKHIIASSNTSDILSYCKKHDIAFLTTLDILAIAVNKKKITNQEADSYIKNIIAKGSFLCCHSIAEHTKKHFNREKLLY